MFDPTSLARETVVGYLRTKAMPDVPSDLSEDWAKQAGVFVSIKKKGRLRGCIGTYLPRQSNIAEEIMVNAVRAATSDPRFEPVTLDELPDLAFSVDLLGPLKRVFDPDELDPKKYGVLVRSSGRTGLLLPDLEGVDTVEKQLDIARSKALIQPDEPVEIFSFTVSRYSGQPGSSRPVAPR